MDRVTKHGHNPCVYCEYRCKWAETFLDDEEPCETVKGYYRAMEIEDILGDDYNLDRLRELVEADLEGRCVVLPIVKQKDMASFFDALSETVSSWQTDMSAGEKKLSEAILKALRGERHGKDL